VQVNKSQSVVSSSKMLTGIVEGFHLAHVD
jgi:hypothetical protein